MLRRQRLIKTICLFLLLLVPHGVFACRCAGSMSSQAAYDKADVVVKGKVVMIDGDISGPVGAKAIISVLAAWKKSIKNKIIVKTSTTCAYDLKKDNEYLLYLYHETDSGNYITQMCIGNLPIEDANQPLNWLKQKGISSNITIQ